MNIKRIKYLSGIAVLSISLMSVLSSCRDETFDIPDYTVSGEDVTVTIQVKLPEMQPLTRDPLNTYNRNMVDNVYIRSYSASTGLATSKWVKDESFTPGQQMVGEEHPVAFTFDTQSGYNYIVAVANVEQNNGFVKGSEDTKPLDELLESADTWEDFLNIVAISPTGDQMTNPNVPLPMVGCYFPETESVHPTSVSQWQNEDFLSYFIPVQRDKPVELPGAIHLRRLISEINFNFKPGSVTLPDGTTCGMDVTVNSFEVVNVPRYSWLYERPAKDGMLANYGDNATSVDDAASYYTSQRFAGNLVDKDNEGVSSFYFYMDENKHTGNTSCTSYNNRAKKLDNGLYSSLTNVGSDSWTPNQMATYVRVSCTIDYEKEITVNDEGQSAQSGSTVTRTANVDYYIHLGYINNSADDFNSYRNCKYTYNVTVNGVNDIVVDAYADDETYHGEEGTVVDLMNETIELDAHYHAFNIELTEEELKNPNFGFIIMTSRSGTQYVFDDEDNFQSGNIDGDQSYKDRELYNWIELHPTANSTTLASYRPRYGTYAGADSNGKITFLLTNLKPTRNANGDVTSTAWDNMTDQMKSTTGWYTVFVNEYSYEPMYEGSNNSSYGNETGGRWREYVNQIPRRFYIKTQRHASPDGNSIYAPSKYGVSQQSMQTYYSNSVDGSTAIGIEWVNETMGMNMRSSFSGSQPNDGRANAAQWLNSVNSSLTINSTSATSRPLWSTFIDQTAMQQVAAVTDADRLQGGAQLPDRLGENAYKVPLLAKYSGVISTDWPTDRDPQSSSTMGNTDISSYIENINACMNRNRDNNGNGRIDPEELRWYVPSSGKYLRLLLGADALNEPLMKWDVGTLPSYKDNKTTRNNYLPRYMFLTSSSDNGSNTAGNGTVLWALEGMSSSTMDQLVSNSNSWSNGISYPWQVRCIRNLGTNLKYVDPTSDDDGVQQAYVVDNSNHTIRMTYYDIASIRSNKFTGNGENNTAYMPIHYINNEEYNSTYRAFQYATSDIELQTNRTEGDIQDYINGNPCNTQFGSGWRIPNQKELAILRNAGILTKDLTGEFSWLSCTALYYNMITGEGGGNPISTNNYILIMFNDRGTIGRSDNLSVYTQRVRCVKDVD